MDFAAILTFFLGVFALAVKPGPGMLAMASRAISQGIGALLLFVAGMNLVKLFFLAIVILGFGIAEDELIFISILIKSLAAVYLIWIGFKGVANPDIDISISENKVTRSFESFNAGVLVTISNPFDILFFAGILPTIIDVKDVGLIEYLIFAGIIIVVETGVALSYSIPMALSRGFFTPSLMRNINLGASIALIIVGFIIGYSALPAHDLISVFK